MWVRRESCWKEGRRFEGPAGRPRARAHRGAEGTRAAAAVRATRPPRWRGRGGGRRGPARSRLGRRGAGSLRPPATEQAVEAARGTVASEPSEDVSLFTATVQRSDRREGSKRQ